MRSRLLKIFVVLLMVGSIVPVHSQQSEDLQSLKDTLSNGDQGSVLQDVLGKEGGNTKKTDKKLQTPDTIRQQNDKDIIEKDIKTREGRILRQLNENPEIRADDTVLIDMRRVDDLCNRAFPDQNEENNGNPPNGQAGANAQAGAAGAALGSLSGLSGAAGASALNAGANAAGGLNSINELNGVSPTNGIGGINGTNNQPPTRWIDLSRCPLPSELPKTEDEKNQEKELQQRILDGNPYKLNRFGILEIPGLPAIPLEGLTASEATKRLAADPDLDQYFVRLTLLRLTPNGQEALKPFGYDLFEGAPSTFAPVGDIQVPTDYAIGPGDTIDIQLYGSESQSYELTVERDGRINFPKLGPIMLSGMSFDEAKQTIEDRVSKQLIGTRVSVTMGELRSIRVFVLGDAQKPGSYTVGGLSTMTNALFVSGGVKKIGSLRNIELKRDGRLVTTLDVYDLLLHGDNSGDRQLKEGDVIFIPPLGDTVSVYGSVRRPAIYELKGERTAQQVIALAGGLLPDADGRSGQMERILPSRLLEMHNIDLNSTVGRSTLMANGDKLRIPSIRPTLENSVELSGYVYRPGSFEYHPGLHLSDVLNSFEELKPQADLHYIMIRRLQAPEAKVEVISADLARALAAPGSKADPVLQPRDKIIVFNLSAKRDRILEPILRDLELQATPDRPEQIVSIDGKVRAPGKYPLEPSMHVSDLIRAGGSLEDSAYRGQAEITRYAVVDGDERQTDLIPVNLAAIRRGDVSADVALKPYDSLVIKPIPRWEEPGMIEIKGEVRFPGKYPIHQGETLHSVLERAGGFTATAFPEGAVFIREDLKKREKDQLELLANRLQSDLAALSLEAVASSASGTGGGGGAAAGQGLLIGQQLLAQLRQTKPVGRLVINIQAVLAGRAGGPGDVLLKNGDELVVPKKTQEITILGEVQSPTSHVFEAGLTRDDYIAKSGGTTPHADRKRIYVVRANGDVVSQTGAGWFRRTHDTEIRPGDTIVVPLDTTKVPTLLLAQAITTIIYNLAIGYILVHEYL